mgnify:CR=1 FL=1
MKFFQKPGVAVVFTIVMIAAALFIGLSPVLKSDKPAETAQTAVPEQTISQTPAETRRSPTNISATTQDCLRAAAKKPFGTITTRSTAKPAAISPF